MQASFTARTTELSQRLESLAGETQRSLTDAQGVLSRVGTEVEPRILDRLNQSIARAADDFEAAATRVSDRQLVRLMEDKQMVTREAAAQLQRLQRRHSRATPDVRHTTMEEFKRQTEVQVDLIISEATQRVMSQLAALDAENRAAIEIAPPLHRIRHRSRHRAIHRTVPHRHESVPLLLPGRRSRRSGRTRQDHPRRIEGSGQGAPRRHHQQRSRRRSTQTPAKTTTAKADATRKKFEINKNGAILAPFSFSHPIVSVL